MERIYQYHKYGYFSLLIAIVVLGGISGGILIKAIYSNSLFYLLLTLSIFIFVLYNIFKCIQNFKCKYILDDTGITIQKPFSNPITIRWDDIIEFGKRRITGRFPYWEFFIQTTDSEHLKIGNEHLVNAEELVTYLFEKAINAKFSVIENTSWVPFVRKEITTEWNIEQ